MRALDVLDLQERYDELARDADDGRLTLVTDSGRPVFVAVPLTDRLLQQGLDKDLAIRLFDDEVLSMGKAAHLAGLDTGEFLDLLAEAGIDAVRYDSDDLEGELERLRGD